MSVNLELRALLDSGGEVDLTLPGFSRGITHSAMVGKGDFVEFGSVATEIMSVIHTWRRGGDDIAPISTAHAETVSRISGPQLEELMKMGFSKNGGVDGA